MTPERKKEKKTRKVYSLVWAGLICCIGILAVAGSIFFIRRIQISVRDEAYYTLRIASEESAKAVTERLQSQVDYLNSVWLMLQEYESDDYRNQIMKQQKRSGLYGFEWIGYADANARGSNSIGRDVDLSEGEMFQKNMAGNIVIAPKIIIDADGGENMVVFLSIPVYGDEKEKPCGILYEAFKPNDISEMLDVGAYDGQAMTCLMEANGDIFAVSERCVFNVNENIIVKLQEYSPDNQAFIDRLTAALGNASQGGGSYSVGAEKRISYFVPVTLKSGTATNTMGLLCILHTDVVDARIKAITGNTVYLAGIVALSVALVGAAIFLMQRAQKRELEQIAYEDALTGEANYEAFKRDFERLKDRSGVLIVFDILDFKLINRYYSVEKGNEALRELGKLFAGMSGQGQLTARVVDDDFIFFFPRMRREEAPQKCEYISKMVQELFQKLKISRNKPVFGYCAVDNNHSIESMRSRAKFAKELAKAKGVGYHAFDEQAAAVRTESMHLLNDFDRALAAEEFEVWYQPKYLVRGRCIGGAEALVRWKRQGGETVSPGRFIPLFESNGKISKLDEYVFARMCRLQKLWMEQGIPVVPVSVNVSRASLLDTGIVERYRSIVEAAGIDKRLVPLEITEDSVEKDVVQIIRDFRKEGFNILMDDFGKGNSNFVYLQDDLFDGVKMDKGFVDGIGLKRKDGIICTLIKMFHNIGLMVVAEGVETQAQAAFLEEAECDEIQGYFYYRPVAEADFVKLLEDKSPA